MTTLPMTIGKPQEVTQATYDKITISTGRIYTTYYALLADITGAATDYSMVTGTIASSTIANFISFVNGEMWNDDFDLSFIRPRRLEGYAYVTVTYYIMGDVDSGGTELYLEISLYKVEDGAETQLGSTVTLPTLMGTNNVDKYYRRTAKITIPITKFRAGDVLRLSVRGVGNVDDSDDKGGYCFDPAGRAWSYTGSTDTTLPIVLPFIPDF